MFRGDWFRVTCLLAGLAGLASAQSFVQISTMRARPPRLNCVGPGATTVVRVQIYGAGLSEEAKKGAVTLNLSVYSAKPSISKMDLRDVTQQVSLADSPALVDFEVNCTSETLPGIMTLGATIVEAPPGILIKEPVQPALVEIRIDPPPQ